MKQIIALQGIGNSGKTTTIQRLRSSLLTSKFSERTISTNNKDFTSIFTRQGKAIGVTSYGDTSYIVAGELDVLKSCDIIICACRSRGGSVCAVREASENVGFITKTYSSNRNLHERANAKDADVLFSQINSFL